MRRLGEQRAKEILKHAGVSRHATVVALYGNLGAGKTVFAQGFGRRLGIAKHIQSPTFVLMRRYALRHKNFQWLYHLDLYRIKKVRDTEYLALNEIFHDPSAIVLIEWADRISKTLPRGAIKIRFGHTKRKNQRKVWY